MSQEAVRQLVEDMQPLSEVQRHALLFLLYTRSQLHQFWCRSCLVLLLIVTTNALLHALGVGSQSPTGPTVAVFDSLVRWAVTWLPIIIGTLSAALCLLWSARVAQALKMAASLEVPAELVARARAIPAKHL